MKLDDYTNHRTERVFNRPLTDEQIKAILISNHVTGFEEDFQKLIRDLNNGMARKEWRGYEPEVHVLDVGLWIIKIVTTNPFKRFFKNTWRPSEYFLYAKAYTLADFIYDNKKPVSGDCFTDFDKGFIGLENIIVKYGYWRKQHTMPNEGMHQSKEMGGDEVIKSLRGYEFFRLYLNSY